MQFSLKVFLGFCFGILSGTSLILNIFALFTVFRLAFILRKNHVYVIAFFNILSDVMQMTMSVFFLTPSIITSSFLVSNRKKSPWTLAFGSAFMFLWYFETITQMIMAFDRYVIICLRKHNLFTFTSTLVMFSLLIPISFVIMYHSQYMNPCCAFLFDQEYLSYSYYPIEGVPNYSDRFDLPLNASSSIISAICYILIFWTVHNSSATFSTVAGDQQKVRRRRDISLLLVFYIFVWVLFRILPILLADRHVEWFILVPIFYTINCTSNAIIYIFFNSEVQSHLIPSQLISVLRYLGITQTSTPVQNRTIASVTAYSSVAPITHVAIRFIPVRKHQPFRSIGLLQNMNQSVV
ncbi:unnamed protein product [Caenorhabditis nigoni]